MQTNIQTRPASPPVNGARPPNRMTLAAVSRGRVEAPPRVLCYGTPGVGKTTFAADAAAAIFVPGEEGTNQLDVARFPRPEAWPDVFEAIRVLRTEKHDYQTLVIDTLDSLEPLCWAHVCRAAGKGSIEEVGGGYGKGYLSAAAEWQRLLAEFEALRRERSLMIVTLAHAQVRTFKNPAGADYDRYTLKLNERAAGLLIEWHDVVLFARYEEYASVDGKRAKGVSTGARVLHTVRTAAWDAKNRYDLPDPLPLEWVDFEAATKSRRPADPARLREEITALVGSVADAELAAKVEAAVAKASDDAAALARVKNRLNAKLAQKER